ncbi:MAG: signal peptidase I [Acidimicrobiia bacterium]
MAITAPDLDIEQGRPDNGLSLFADPWSDGWNLPTAEELKAVGWPGARPPPPASSDRLEAVPDLVAAEQVVEPIADMPADEPLGQPAGGVLTKPGKLDGAADEPEGVIDLTEPEHRRSRTPKWARQHLHSLRRLRLAVVTLATAYWYFALATLAIAVAVPLAAGWSTTTVMSDSMEPTISAGDVLAFADYDGSLLDVGTIIQFDDQIREDSTVTHRIVGVNADGTYQTKGDANRGSDSTQVPTGLIIGVGRMVSPYAGLPHYWLVTGQYVWLAAWILLTAAAATFMAVNRASGNERARPVPKVPKVKTRGPRLVPTASGTP